MATAKNLIEQLVQCRFLVGDELPGQGTFIKSNNELGWCDTRLRSWRSGLMVYLVKLYKVSHLLANRPEISCRLKGPTFKSRAVCHCGFSGICESTGGLRHWGFEALGDTFFCTYFYLNNLPLNVQQGGELDGCMHKLKFSSQL
jgi:hypothetical protein